MNPKEVGARIRALREHLKLSRTQMAQRLDLIKAQQLADVELGRQKAPVDMLQKLIGTFPIRAGWLLEGEGEMLKSRTFEETLDALGLATQVMARLAISDAAREPLRDVLFYLLEWNAGSPHPAELQTAVTDLADAVASLLREVPATEMELGSPARSELLAIFEKLGPDERRALLERAREAARLYDMTRRLADLERGQGPTQE